MQTSPGGGCLDITPETIIVNISGGTGDADLYLRHGAQPTGSSFNCRPYITGNAEFCRFANPSAGTWYIKYQSVCGFFRG
ncbi:MAG: PPC domain-containing protein [Gammaproteobacteria bacterium]|nr:PPC domain-containing protein [Gammaproteobacteria bacterium]